jgi:hypothetical protein
MGRPGIGIYPGLSCRRGDRCGYANLAISSSALQSKSFYRSRPVQCVHLFMVLFVVPLLCQCAVPKIRHGLVPYPVGVNPVNKFARV